VSSLPIEGALAAKPLAAIAGSLSGSLRGPAGQLTASLAEGNESPETAAIAEVSNLISSLGSLSAQAQTLPLSAPTLPGLPQGGYRPAATDYMQFAEDAD
jgi:hypothetical protein